MSLTTPLVPAIGDLGRRLGDLPVGLVAAAAFAVTLLADGVGTSPAFGRFLTMAQTPMSDPGITGTGSFVLSSPAGSWIAATVGATSPATFAAVHGLLVAVAFAGSVWAVTRKHGPAAGKVIALMWAALPLSTVLVTWVGQPDPLMVAAGTALAVVTSPAAVAGWALLAGVTGGLQALVLVTVVAVVGRRDRRWLAAAVVGVAVGVATVSGWHRAAGIVQDTNRVQYMAAFGLPAIVGRALSAWQPLIWSLFAGVWPVVAAYVRDRRTVLTLLALVGLSVVTFDSTRVFALMSWPVMVLLAPQVDDDRAVGWLVVAAMLVPAGVVWAGQVI